MDTENDFTSIIKQYSSYIFIALINIYIIYWIYKNIITDNPLNPNNLNNPIQNPNPNINPIQHNPIPSSSISKPKSKYKPKMTINANGLLFKNEHDIHEDTLYQILDSLSDNFELFLIIQVKPDKQGQHKEIIDKFNTMIEDNLVYKHRILFCNTIEGLCSMIRSIDPIVHVEYNNYVVINLIRYINEFWFVNENKDKEYKEIMQKVKNDSNNCKLNIMDLMNKVKCFKELNEIMDKSI